MGLKLYLALKRIFDIVAASLGILVTLPFWIIAMIGIFLSDPGPVFFCARRIGKDNKEFKMLKFRSMTVAKTEKEKNEASFKADTNRIFAFGHVIRALKIDELPQLLNIISGSMSIVGPRPVSVDQAEIMRGGENAITGTVRPGLTGPAALYDYIYGDKVKEQDEYERLVLPTRLKLEAYYPEHMSVGLDIKMICYTVLCVIYTLFNKTPNKILKELKDCSATERV